nr:MAG TPA: Preprotein translocase subunit [Caudoviricetes sp.]
MPLRGGIILLFIYYFVLRWKLLRQKRFMRMIFHTLVVGDMTYLNEGI